MNNDCEYITNLLDVFLPLDIVLYIYYDYVFDPMCDEW